LPLVLVLDWVRSWYARSAIFGLIGVSAANVWIQTVANRQFPNLTYSNPVFQHSLPSLAHADVAINVGTVLLIPVVKIGSPLTLIPLVLAVAAWTWRCKRAASRGPATESEAAPAELELSQTATN
jgi:hypothetical protein